MWHRRLLLVAKLYVMQVLNEIQFIPQYYSAFLAPARDRAYDIGPSNESANTRHTLKVLRLHLVKLGGDYQMATRSRVENASD